MAKILKASDYGFRKVIVVVLNPDDPQWVHTDGSVHPVSSKINCVPVATPGVDSLGKPLDSYYGICTYNWKEREFIWTGDEMYKLNAEGQQVEKTASDLTKEIEGALTPAPVATAMTSLVDKVV